ncbi:MAG: hypothetical protein ACYDH9_14290 [Limisphaerales bacterium]
MKTFLGILVLVAGAYGIQGQTNTPAGPVSQIRATQKKADRPLTLTSVPLATDKIGGKTVHYGGFLVDLGRSKDPLRLVNPLRAGNSGSSTENVLYEPRTGRAQGIALLSIRF